MDAPLFDIAPPAARGPVRAALDAHLTALRARPDVTLADDLAILVQSLADRIDQANAGRDRRGYVMLSAEYRAARDALLQGVTDDDASDPIGTALQAFMAEHSAEASDTPGPLPAD